MGKEVLFVLATLSQLTALKMDEPILNVKGWVKIRTAITATRSYSWVLRGAQDQSNLRTQELDWASGLGLGMEK